MITELEKAYLAGLIDGEGCIYVDRFKDKRKKNSNPGFVLRLKITMTCKKTIQWVHDTISKEFECSKIFANKGYEYIHTNRKQCYEFKFAKELNKFLGYILPYSITKRSQIELGLRWSETKYDNAKRGRNSRFMAMPDDILKNKEEIYAQFRLLNKKGR